MKAICDVKSTSPVKKDKDSLQQEVLDTVKLHRDNVKKLEKELKKPSQAVAQSMQNIVSSSMDMQILVA